MKKSILFLFVLALGLSACQQKKDFKVNVSLANGTYIVSVGDKASKVLVK